MKRYIKSSRADKLERAREEESQLSFVNKVAEDVNALYGPKTGLYIYHGKYRFIDADHVVISWFASGHTIYWYNKPGRMKPESKYVLPVNYSSSDLSNYVAALVDRTPKELANDLFYLRRNVIKEMATFSNGLPNMISEKVSQDMLLSTMYKEFSESIVNRATFERLALQAIRSSDIFSMLDEKIDRYNERVKQCEEIYDYITQQTYEYPLLEFKIYRLNVSSAERLDNADYYFKFDSGLSDDVVWWARSDAYPTFFFPVDRAIKSIERDFEERIERINSYKEKEN